MSWPAWLRSREAWDRWYVRALPAYWIFLFSATHFPRLELTGPIPKSDKLHHMLAYGLLAFLFWRFAQVFHRPLSPRFVWLAGILLVSYAAADEYLQGFVNRGPDVFDWLADVAGIVLVLGLLEWYRRRQPRATGFGRREVR